MRTLALMAAGCLLFAPAAMAQTAGAGGSDAKVPAGAGVPAEAGFIFSEQDRTLVRMMAQSNLAEPVIAKLALDRAQSAEVKAYAQQMIADHEVAHQQLQQLARRYDIDLPARPAERQEQAAKTLATLNGAAFDRQYVGINVTEHQMIVKALQAEVAEQASPRDPLHELAQKQLPILQHHLAMAQGLQANLEPTASTR